LHRFRLIASCINSYDSFCHRGEVGSIPTVIPTVLNHSLNEKAQLTYSISSKILVLKPQALVPYVPTKPVFPLKKFHLIYDWGHGPPAPFSRYATGSGDDSL